MVGVYMFDFLVRFLLGDRGNSFFIFNFWFRVNYVFYCFIKSFFWKFVFILKDIGW